MTEEKKQYRSVSQVNQYNKCPYAYYLSRRKKAWRRPAAWLAQGSAVHEAAEVWERSGRTMTLEQVQEVFREVYQRYINESCEITPNFKWWFSSGRYDGKTDTERRYGLGLEQVERYLNWAARTPERVIWIAPDGTPGIELKFDIELDGIPVTGFIDQVSVVDDEVEVVDLKTGNQPGDDFQLGTYAVALAEQFGIETPTKGAYWMGRVGKLTVPYDLTDWTRDAVAEAFAELDENIRAERFDPIPDADACRFCDVSYACEFRMA